ncbi:unnamed protein product [marine sediment metagenome]|uniref:Uncharacterized protein n=1 Tax=marine sediment metagenome TaxID=412755 RepID=X1B7I9_9ZZZZ
MGLFKEKMEYLGARFNSCEGIFEWLISSAIFGFIIVNYTDKIYGEILKFISFVPDPFVSYVAYLLFGLILLPLGIIITYTLTRIFRLFFKNRRII